MNTIIKHYKLLINKYRKIEIDSAENEIHDKRIILRRIFPILAAYKMKPSRLKNGVKAFKMFGKLRDIQVQVLKLERTDQTHETIEYLSFLKEQESKLRDKVRKFSKKNELGFPPLEKKSRLGSPTLYCKADKSLNSLIATINSKSIDDAKDIHKIRIKFKKFRYKVEILSYIENIDDAKFENLKQYQDMLGEIQDYDILIKGIKKYYKKRKLFEEDMIEIFENEQNVLIENFDNHVQKLMETCRDAITLGYDIDCMNADSIKSLQALGSTEITLDIKNHFVGSTDDQSINKIDPTSPVNEHPLKKYDAVGLDVDTTSDTAAKNPIEDQTSDSKNEESTEDSPGAEEENKDNQKEAKPNRRKRKVSDTEEPIDSDHSH